MAAPVGHQAHVQVVVRETAEQAEERRLERKSCVFGAKFIEYTAASATGGSIAGAILAPVTMITAASGAAIGTVIAVGAGSGLRLKHLITGDRPACALPDAEAARSNDALPLDPEYPPGEACADAGAACGGAGTALLFTLLFTTLPASGVAALPMSAVVATAGLGVILGAGIVYLARDLKDRCIQWRRGTPLLTPPIVQLNPINDVLQGGINVQVRVVQLPVAQNVPPQIGGSIERD